MRLHQAILRSKDTGRHFRRADWDDECMWMHVSLDRDGIEFIEFVDTGRFAAHVSDLCADNWEMAPEKVVEVTRSILEHAIFKCGTVGQSKLAQLFLELGL